MLPLSMYLVNRKADRSPPRSPKDEGVLSISTLPSCESSGSRTPFRKRAHTLSRCEQLIGPPARTPPPTTGMSCSISATCVTNRRSHARSSPCRRLGRSAIAVRAVGLPGRVVFFADNGDRSVDTRQPDHKVAVGPLVRLWRETARLPPSLRAAGGPPGHERLPNLAHETGDGFSQRRRLLSAPRKPRTAGHAVSSCEEFIVPRAFQPEAGLNRARPSRSSMNAVLPPTHRSTKSTPAATARHAVVEIRG